MKKNEVGGRGMYRGEERCVQGIGGDAEGKRTLEGLGVGGRKILHLILRK
jgi:hypothetical protein